MPEKRPTPPAATPPSNEIGRVEPRSITAEIEESYLDYAMSVIVARALPDARDGLKPVHRRILYAMWSMGLKPSAKFRKSATVVGEVLGKYHPHGDIAVYDSMVRMAQDFSLRYPLVHGQGNFGSLDGDNAAAHRYTEAKLAHIAEEMLTDIERDTVDFVPNYDASQKEPTVLPAKLPNLLLNGNMGIAVGMATSIPPHNLTELIDGVTHLIDHPHATVEDLLQFIKGPDFPTAGEIFDAAAIREAYATGRGAIVTRAKAEIVEGANGYQIVVTEIPYLVNKADLITKIADLVHDKKIDGIRDLRDESDKDGVRIVVELKRDSFPKKVLNRLFSTTQLQETFHLNLVALVDGGLQPRVLTLKAALESYIEHRKEVVRRRAAFDLARATERAHILKGLKIALDHLDAVISTIRRSRDKDEAKVNLIKKFKLTDPQAIAILEMRLAQLANLERKRVEDELKEKLVLIKELEVLLATPKKILGVIKTELTDLKAKYGDERRTRVNPLALGRFSAEDLVPNVPTVIIMTRDGYIKRVEPASFKTQGRGGKGVIGLTRKEEDTVALTLLTNTHANLLFFSSQGRVFQLKAYDVPAASRTAKGQAIVNFLQLTGNERVSAMLYLEKLVADKGVNYLVMVTKRGVIKKVALAAFENIRRTGIIALKLKGGDELEWVKPSSGKNTVALVTKNGQAIRFSETQVRAMGRSASGVRGMKLKKDDEIVGMNIAKAEAAPGTQLLVVMENGFGKRTFIKHYKIQGRGGSGVKTAEVTAKTGPVVDSKLVDPDSEAADLIVISTHGQVIRVPIKSISILGRATQGVRIMRFSEKNDKIASVTVI